MKLFLTLILLALPSMAVAQTPCPTTPPTAVSLNPSVLEASLPEHTTMEADGTTPRVTDYQVAYFAVGANPNVATPVVGPIVLQKTAFTLAVGTTDCYLTPIPAPAQSTPLIGALKSRRAATPTLAAAESPYGSVSNPFASAPSVLAAPGLRRAR